MTCHQLKPELRYDIRLIKAHMRKHDDRLVHVQQVSRALHSYVQRTTKACHTTHETSHGIPLTNLCNCRHNAQLQVPPRTFSVKLQRVCLLMADVQGFTEIASKITARYAIGLARMLHFTYSRALLTYSRALFTGPASSLRLSTRSSHSSISCATSSALPR